jgi:hypothetical protein
MYIKKGGDNTMIVAKVIEFGSPGRPVTKLFNCTMDDFNKMADKRYVEVIKVESVSNQTIIEALEIYDRLKRSHELKKDRFVR